MTPKVTRGKVVLLLIKLTFLRCSWDLNIPLQSIILHFLLFTLHSNTLKEFVVFMANTL